MSQFAFNEPLLYADLTFYPMTEKQIKDVLNKEIIAIVDNYYEYTPEELGNFYKEYPNAPSQRYTMELFILRKEKDREEYKWYLYGEEVDEDEGSDFKYVTYFSFRPKLRLQNGNKANIQISDK